MEAYPLEPWSFREYMDIQKDLAAARDRNVCRYPTAIRRARPSLILWRTVAEVAEDLGVSQARIRYLAAAGRFGKCRRSRTGTGRPIEIPAFLQEGGGYKLALTAARKGPKLRLALSPVEEVPF